MPRAYPARGPAPGSRLRAAHRPKHRSRPPDPATTRTTTAGGDSIESQRGVTDQASDHDPQIVRIDVSRCRGH
ncbi:hypothetical protein ACI2L1_13025 [Streptomyces sp. NPDC019531]|uniref:hypothetical protein n=1 Tax=Streptomyces sp. NPDC019531 TaxID=3365062 RepID=UPI00384A95C8